MPWEPREGSKVAVLIAAMEAQRVSRPIWTQSEAAQVMGLQRAAVPQYVAAACNGGRVFRRTLANGGGIELSLMRFPGQPTPLAIPSFTEEAAAVAAGAAVGWVPPQMMAPRPGSDVRLPSRAPGTPPAVPGAGPVLQLEATSEDAAGAEAYTNDTPETPEAETQEAPAEDQEEGGPEAGEEEEVVPPDAFLSARTGALVITGIPPDEDGAILIPPELVQEIRRMLTWSLPR